MTAQDAFMDLGVTLSDRPGSLAAFGQALGAAGVSLEGGGVVTHEGHAIAHFLVDHAEEGRVALEAQGIGPVTLRRAVMLHLDQDLPGQLGAFTGRVSEAGINILVQYSDHQNRLVLVVSPDRHEDCLAIAAEWDRTREWRVPA